MHPAIETSDLVKRFGRLTAVDGVSLHVERGEIYGFLGLNGAGKTTTIRMLLGMMHPNAGEVWVLGKKIDFGTEKPWEKVGYMVEIPHAYPELTVRENLETCRRLRPGVKPEAVEDVIERMGLGEYVGRRARTLSHGNAQRLGLAKALLHQPELLLLDEPANGLDPAGIVEIRAMLSQLAGEKGVCVFMSSHILAEVTRLAQRIGIIHQGRLIRELSMDELEKERRVRLLVQARQVQAALDCLVSGGIKANLDEDGYIEITDKGQIERREEIATRLVQAGQPPTMLKVEQEDLESYFLRLVGVV